VGGGEGECDGSHLQSPRCVVLEKEERRERGREGKCDSSHSFIPRGGEREGGRKGERVCISSACR